MQTIDIEDALRWAYRDELPKGWDEGTAERPSGPTNPLARMIAIGSKIDNWTREPGFPRAMGEPHPDAIAIGSAVQSLDPEILDLVGFDIRHKLSDRVSTRDAELMLEVQRRDAVARVMTRAKLGGRPDVTSEREVAPVTSSTGQITVWIREGAWHGPEGAQIWVEHDAVLQNKGRGYKPGAFTKVFYTPECEEIAHDRAIYAVWWASLERLAGDLAGRLESMRIAAPAAPRAPWTLNRAAQPERRALRDLSPPPPPATSGRRAPLRPTPRSAHGPVRNIPVRPAA